MSKSSLLPSDADQSVNASRRSFLLALPVGIWLLANGIVQAGYRVTGKLSSLSPPLIEALQRRLHELGYDPGPVDGRWGPQTAGAYAAFCENSDLPVADQLTREHVQALWNVDFDPETASGPEMVMFLETIGVRF